MATKGCQWRQLPKDFPQSSKVQRYLYDWRDSGLLASLRFLLSMQTRELEGRETSPTAGVVDSRSVKTTESDGIRGYGAGKKFQGRKSHIIVDTMGLLFGIVIHVADIQDRDGAPTVLASIRKTCPWLRHVFADGGYARPKLLGSLEKLEKWTLEIVWRTDKGKGFEVLLRPWVVERTFAWHGRCRRIAKDWERLTLAAEAWINVTHFRLTTRRIARYCYPS